MEEIISEHENILIEKFREAVHDVIQSHHDDVYLLKWIRARCGNLQKAESMLRDHLIFRENIGADTILETWDPPEVLQLYYPGCIFGEAKDGSPIWIDSMGRVDVRGIHRSCKVSDIIKYKVYHCEQIQRALKSQSDKHGGKIMGLFLFVDFDGFGLSHLWKPHMDLTIKILKMFEANYPETLKRVFLVNMPRIFPVAIKVIRPFLSEDTKNKFVFTGRDWKSKLLEYVDADQLPKHWGGNLVGEDGDEFCRSLGVKISSEVPRSYYLEMATFNDSGSSETITVSRGSTEQIEKIVKEPGSILRWQFKTASNDIGFGIFLRTASCRQKAGEMKEIIASQRVNSHLAPEDGVLNCDTPGTYVLRFDNTYSWVSSKKVTYVIDVLQADDNNSGIIPTRSDVCQTP